MLFINVKYLYYVELFRYEAEINQRTDVYKVCIVLFYKTT